MKNKEHEIDVISQVCRKTLVITVFSSCWLDFNTNAERTVDIENQVYIKCKVKHVDSLFFFYFILQRLNEARRMMDKLRACIVANYYANAGMTKHPEVTWDAYRCQVL